MLGRYHLVLAHEVLQHPEEYAVLFKGRGYFTILDNGTVELGEPLPKEHLLKAAEIVHADVIALPDILEDSEGTIDRICEFLGELSAAEYHQLSFMAIPQGKTLEEFASSVKDISNALGPKGVRLWGVPRAVANRTGTRSHAMTVIRAHQNRHSDIGRVLSAGPYIHLLGMSRNLGDDIECARHPAVLGIDSANPIVLGLQGRDLFNAYDHLPAKTDDFDYWRTWELANPNRVKLNIHGMRSAITSFHEAA